MASFTLGTRAFGFVVLLLCFCSIANSSFDIKKFLDEDIFKKCSQIECSNPDFANEEMACFEKLSEQDQEIFANSAAECYGISNIHDVEPREFMKIFCSDIPRAYECEKKGIETFLEAEHSDDEKALWMEYSECVAPLYGACMD